MVTLTTIREDLKEIRYYYSRKDFFDKGFDNTGVNEIINKVKKYNIIATKAPPKLYDMYLSLYINYNTQELLADKLSYTPEYIQKLNKRLLKFLQENFIEND